MSMYFRTGDICSSHCQYICHQVNCQGKMNSGVAKAIREKWPIVYDKYVDWQMSYEAWAHTAATNEERINELLGIAMLGRTLQVPVSENQTVINLAAQLNYGYDKKRYTSYDAFWMCLGEILKTVPKESSIAFPARIGCVRGGANWDVILTMIEAVLEPHYEIYIYYLEGDSM